MIFRFVTPVVRYVRILWRVLLPPYSGCSEALVPLYLTRRRHISDYLYRNILRQLYPIHVFTTVLSKLIPVLPPHGDLLLWVLCIPVLPPHGDLLLWVLCIVSSIIYSYQNINDQFFSSVVYSYQNVSDQFFPPSYIPIKMLTIIFFLRLIFLSKY
jgi:hypothetical protein